VARLEQLSDVVTKGKDAVNREFVMRVPAEADYDPDLVLSEAAARLKKMGESLLTIRQEVSSIVGAVPESLKKFFSDTFEEDFLLEADLEYIRARSDGKDTRIAELQMELGDVSKENKRLAYKLEVSQEELIREVRAREEADKELRRDRALEINGEDAWRWAGDGEDRLESMGNDMAVLIRAEDLRKLSKAAENAIGRGSRGDREGCMTQDDDQ